MSALKWSYTANSQGEIARDTAFGGTPLTIAGKAFTHGLGAYSGSVGLIAVSGRCTAFQASVGIDQIAGGKGSVGFEVWADGKRVFSSGVVTGADGAKSVDVDLTGVTGKKCAIALTVANANGANNTATTTLRVSMRLLALWCSWLVKRICVLGRKSSRGSTG